jgi:hypothetical protein
MPTNERPLQRPHRLALSREEHDSLQYGDLPGRPAFADDEERRAAWFHHRDRLLRHCSHGQRPAGWWDFESPVPRPRDRDYAAATLFEAGLLTESEIAELTATWRRDFERAQDLRFAFCVGFARPGDLVSSWLKGAPARKQLYRWSGIPKALVRKWTRERRRRQRTNSELEETAVRPTEPVMGPAEAPGGHLPHQPRKTPPWPSPGPGRRYLLCRGRARS